MAHVPHVYLPAPWPDGTIPLLDRTRHHLRGVLRARPGDEVTYTDGFGSVGVGALASDGVVRGDERSVPAPSRGLAVAVAPPRRTERARVVVEKLGELGVDRLVWLDTAHGGRPPRHDKVVAWTVAALEQSRGAHLLDVAEQPIRLHDLRAGSGQPLWVAEAGHNLLPSVADKGEVIVAIGPEAGFAEEEIPADALRFGLGGRILRVETAAIVAAVVALSRMGRLDG